MEQFANNAQSTLASSITAGATQLTVQSAVGFSTSGNFRIQIDNEILLVTAVSGNVFTVSRGQEGTVAVAHNAAACVTQDLTAGALQALKSDILPSGVVVPFAAASVPSGWLACDGSAVSRTTYAALFTAIGTTWGAGDGSTTFNLPDLRRRVLLGDAGTQQNTQGPGTSVGNTGGEEMHTLTTAEMPSHNHGPNPAGDNFAVNVVGNSVGIVGGNVSANGVGFSIGTANTGGGASHNTMPPAAVVKWIIKT